MSGTMGASSLLREKCLHRSLGRRELYSCRPFHFSLLYLTWYCSAMKRYVVLEKFVGQTPLECAEAWRAEHPQYADVPLAYAGRLDPMASGKLLILIGEECKQQARYHGLDKRYEFQVLCGFSSDSGDVLGLAKRGGSAEMCEAQIKANR